MNPIGIMQGRLSPPVDGALQAFPVDTWQTEFRFAADLGAACLEWIYDSRTCDDNPLLTASGVEEIRCLQDLSGVQIWSVCGDYFRDSPFIRTGGSAWAARVERLRHLIHQCQRAGIGRVMIPFVDGASIETDTDIEQARDALRAVLPAAEAHHVVITIETSLAPHRFRHFVESVDHPALRVTYDIGDRVSLGYDPAAEIELLGPWLEVVHVKDRVKGGASVPLGTGDADMRAACAALARIGYGGPLILQCAREGIGDEVSVARRHLALVRTYLEN
jgi:L-ribulose-5-phosphate 3-epimerase